MQNKTYLFVTSTAPSPASEPKPEHIRYIPVSCEEHELQQAIKAVYDQHGLPVVGVVSKEMLVGMLQAIENFEKGR
jgi:hypothetical protein